MGFYQAGVEVFWRKQELARASDNVSSRNEAPNRIPALLPRFRRDWNMGGCRLFESLPSSDLSGSRLSVENILDYISNNLNQLAKKKKNTRFLLLCLALTFLQPWLNRQERVVKLNLRNKNRSFGTSQTHTAGAPKSLLFFHVSNGVMLPSQVCDSGQAAESWCPLFIFLADIAVACPLRTRACSDACAAKVPTAMESLTSPLTELLNFHN